MNAPAVLFCCGLTGLVIGSTLGVGMSSASAQSNACVYSSSHSPLVAVTRREGPVTFDNTLSRRELTQLQSRQSATSALVTWASVGLTRTELKYQLRVQIEAYQMRNGRYCARLAEVQADLGYDGFDVFIARRYQPGTCAYKVITEHELTHVSVFRQALNEFYPRMLRRLERAAQNMDPIVAASANSAATRMQSRLKSAVDPLYREMNRSLDRRNARLDTRERYQKEQERCANW